MPGDNSRLVYSTDGGRVRSPAGSPPRRKPSAPPAAYPADPGDGVVRLHRGKPGKGGKPATLIVGLAGPETALDATLKQLKTALGAGGTRDGRVLIIQGDHREKLKPLLEQQGHRVKVAGS